jgi:hypothetical protein
MTQKELSYYEDAIGHEDNIIKIITESINNLTDNKLISFMESEKEKHQQMRKRLMNILESECNE